MGNRKRKSRKFARPSYIDKSSQSTNQVGLEKIEVDDDNNQEKKEVSEFKNQEGREDIVKAADNNPEKKKKWESDSALVDRHFNSISDADDLAIQFALLQSPSQDKEALLDVKKGGKTKEFFPPSYYNNQEKREESEFTNQEGTEEIAMDDDNNQEMKEEPDEGMEGIGGDDGNNQEKKEEPEFRNQRGKKEIGGDDGNNQEKKEEPEPEPDYCVCVICNDAKQVGDLIKSNCGHYFCEDCIKNYVGGKLNEDIFSVKCPEKECEKLLSDELWRRYIPEEMSDTLEKAVAESKVLAEPLTFKCPECLGDFIDDGRGYPIRACRRCWTLLCTSCWFPCHMGMTCDEFFPLDDFSYPDLSD